MTIRNALIVGFASFAVLGGASTAMACSSSLAMDVHGHGQTVDARARDCAQWGIYAAGRGSLIKGIVAGPGTRAVSGSIGARTHTSMDVQGFDNQVGTEARSGGRVDAYAHGDRNEMALRSRNGSTLGVDVEGSDNQVRGEAN